MVETDDEKQVFPWMNLRTRLPRSFRLRHEVWSEPMPLLEQSRGLWFAAMPSYAAKPVADEDNAAMSALAEFITVALFSLEC